MFNIAKTQEDIIKEEMREINTASEAGLLNLIQSNWTAYNLFWNNPQVAPQEFCDLMKNDAYKLFMSSADSQAFIKKMKPDHEPLSIPKDVDVKFNEDGTVTITDNRIKETHEAIN
jgi:hypothetical protein